MKIGLNIGRLAKFDPKVGSRRTTQIKNLVVLVIILVVLLSLPCGTSSHTAVVLVRERYLERFVGMNIFGLILSQKIWKENQASILG